MTDQIVEWAPFRLRAGVTEQMLLEAADALQRDFLQAQAGFRGRHLLRGPDGAYVDLVWWATRADADAAMRQAANSSACSTYFTLMGAAHSDPGADVVHFGHVKSYA